MSSSILEVGPEAAVDRDDFHPRRLLVTVRDVSHVNPRHRVYTHVGILTCSADGFSFEYTVGARQDPQTRPLPGFSDMTMRYEASDMFPLFAQRVMSSRRSDRGHYLQALDLAAESEPWEVLSRSGGRRSGDSIEMIPEPLVREDGSTTCIFLVHGVRHRGQTASDAICALSEGELLTLRLDTVNPINPRAVLVQCSTGAELGYVPDPLVEYVRTAMRDGSCRLSVVRANGPEVGAHMRLLVRLDGKVPNTYRPF